MESKDEKVMKIKITEKDRGYFLLDFLVECKIANLSKTMIRKHLKDEVIYCKTNGRIVTKPRHKLKMNDEVFIKTHLVKVPETKIVLKSMNQPLEVLYEEDSLLILNKPRGLIVHPTKSNFNNTPTLVNVLIHHYGIDNLSKLENDPLRPGIVHRLDRRTSGCMVVAKTPESHSLIKEQFMEHSRFIRRSYLTLVCGHLRLLQDSITLDIGRHPTHYMKRITRDPLNPQQYYQKKESTFRDAKTNYTVLEEFEFENSKFSLIRCTLETGRTHQIRVHFSSIGHPCVGDTLYGMKWPQQPEYLKEFLSSSFSSDSTTVKKLSKEEFGSKQNMNNKKKRKKKRRGGGKRKSSEQDEELGGQVLHAEVLEFIKPEKYEGVKDSYGIQEDVMSKFEEYGEYYSEEEEGEEMMKQIDKPLEIEEKEEIDEKDLKILVKAPLPPYFCSILKLLRERGKRRVIEQDEKKESV